MADYLTEQEQIQQLKNWVKQYGFTVLLGIIIALVITYGWRYWQNYHSRILQHASITYDEMLVQRAQNNTIGAINKANKLLSQYPKTPYADMASLMLAQNDVLKKNYKDAKSHLDWVIQHSKTTSTREIARIRYARILITEKNPDAALKMLTTMDDKNFIGLIDEVRGDAYVAKNDLPAAKKAYQKALDELPNAEITRPILEIKLENLA